MATQNQINSNFWRIAAATDTAGNVIDISISGNLSATNIIGNVSGNISNAAYAETANIANTAAVTNLALSIAGVNVVGNVLAADSANFATYSSQADSALTVAGANVTGTVANSNYAAYSGDVINAAQSNITSLGTLTGLDVAGTANIGNLNLTGNVLGSLLPNANVTYDLGSSTQRWRDLWISNTTIHLGDTVLSTLGSNLAVNGNLLVSQSNTGRVELGSNANVAITGGSNGQALITDGTGNLSWGNAGGSNANVGNFTFANTTMSTPNEDIMLIQTTDTNSNLRTQMYFDPNLGKARMLARNQEQSSTYTTWTSATYTGTEINVVDAPSLINFLNTGAFSYGTNKTFTVNGGNRLAYQGYSAGGNNATIYTNVTADPDPTTVTSMEFFWQLESKFEIDYDDGAMNINSTGMSIYLDNDQSQGPDIWLRSGDDITIQAKDKTLGSESEGGDINIYAGDGAGDDGLGNLSSSGGDLQIYAGTGGHGSSDSGSQGGTARFRAGDGGGSGVTNVAGQGGFVEISAGAGGPNNGNSELGAQGGYVDIYAGQTTLANNVGGNVSIRSGEGGDNAIAGNVQIITPASGPGAGGTWTFDGYGLLTLPNNSVISSNITNIKINSNVGGAVELISDGGNYIWGFDNYGYTQLPVANPVYTPVANCSVLFGGDNLDIKVGSANFVFSSNNVFTLANGLSTIQSIANSSLDPTNPNVSTIMLTPDSNYSSQVLVLDPTAPGHIHLRAHASSNIDEPSANIFLGGENTSFEVTSGSNNDARIHSGGNTWVFGADGNLTVPGVVGTYIKSVANGYIGMSVIDNGADQPAQLVSMNAASGLGTTAISVYANNALIQTGITGNMQTWVFDASGNLTLPGNTFAVNYANGTQVSIGGGGGSASTVDITNTNGLTTTYYPTFVENRTTGQIVRADVDLSYRTDTNTLTVGNISGNVNGYSIGYRDIPQIAASNATLALGDAGKHYYSTTAGNLTLTVPTNANVAFPTGTAISIVVQAAGNVLVNAASGVTLYMAGNSTSGNRVVGIYGMATLMKVASDTWFINGTGVS